MHRTSRFRSQAPPRISSEASSEAPLWTSSRLPSRVRMCVLLGVVLLAASLPLVGAAAGSADRENRRRDREERPRDRKDLDKGGPHVAPDIGRDLSAGPDFHRRAGFTSAACGPELASPEGVEAQTCVMRRGGDTWARTYYRNATDAPLALVLTFMRPDGLTRQVHCAVAPDDAPGACDTPWEPGIGRVASAVVGAGAVAEVTSPQGRLLLRSGSNPPPGMETPGRWRRGMHQRPGF
ncbi:hypothetical protein [Streptomyces sp. XD-27]|uniref:hypothetical protein n=1 Tax=Streptomyces sp. XD-27 TaxID=3062779 RepID=UPI0026F44563|nr:hypothetical protein [Streptomyces sp. XD-27]WKX71652.1 hypothetical protein Q3Y56_18560 [Streptomyces sp. XD-27]